MERVELIGAVGDDPEGGLCLDWLDAARQAGLSASIELSSNTHEEVRPHADLVFLNTQELRAGFGIEVDALGPDTVARIARKRGATLVITHGPDSVICATTESIEHFPVTSLQRVVDRTGGGDAFDAGFIAGWLESDRSLAQAVASGLESARQVLQQVGGARASG